MDSAKPMGIADMGAGEGTAMTAPPISTSIHSPPLSHLPVNGVCRYCGRGVPTGAAAHVCFDCDVAGVR